MKKKNFAKFEVICYVVAAVLMAAAIYMLIENISYMNEYLAAYGMTFTGLGSQAVQSIISAFVPYFAYAFLVFAAGRIYHAVAAPKCVSEDALEEVVEEVLELEAPAEEVVEVAAEEVVEVAAEEVAEVAAEEVVEAPASVDKTEEAAEEEK